MLARPKPMAVSELVADAVTALTPPAVERRDPVRSRAARGRGTRGVEVWVSPETQKRVMGLSREFHISEHCVITVAVNLFIVQFGNAEKRRALIEALAKEGG